MITKQLLVRMIIYSELMVLGLFYIFSPHGVQAITTLQRECTEVEQHIMRIKQDILEIEREMVAWHNDNFYKEKIAREQLQMARADEEIYLV